MKKHNFAPAIMSLLALSATSFLLAGCGKSGSEKPAGGYPNAGQVSGPGNATTDPAYLNRKQGGGSNYGGRSSSGGYSSSGGRSSSEGR